MAQLVSAGKSLLLTRCISVSYASPCMPHCQIDLTCDQLSLQSESPPSIMQACMEACFKVFTHCLSLAGPGCLAGRSACETSHILTMLQRLTPADLPFLSSCAAVLL